MTTGTSPAPLLARARDIIRRHGLLRGGETVLAAVSGGADSVALADVLAALHPELGLTVHVLHVHHGLRPEADADAESVRALCERLGLPFHLERVRVRRPGPGEAGAAWEGLEAEARRARYAAFRARAAALGASRVATGHTADDQAETVIMRLLAGAGPRGLAGIAPARGLYVRPLLEARRADVLAHLAARGLAWVEDASNRDPAFLRNRIRHDVLPFLAERLDPDVVASLCRGAAAARGVVADLERRAAAALEGAARPGAGGLVIAVSAIATLPGDLAAETLRQAALRVDPRLVALRAPGERALRRLLDPGAPRRPARLGRVTIERSGRWLRVAAGAPAAIETRRFPVPGRVALDELGLVLDAREVPASPAYRFSLDRATVAFDADQLPPCLTVRARRRGDRFTPFGGPGLRRLKSFLIDAAVPRWERDRVPLVEADGEIVWVVGLRRGAGAPVSAGTRRILEVTVRGPLAASLRAE